MRWFGSHNSPASRLAAPTQEELALLYRRALGDNSGLVQRVYRHGGRIWIVNEPWTPAPTVTQTLVGVGHPDETP